MGNRTDSTGKRRTATARRMGGGREVGKEAPTAKGGGCRRRKRTKQREEWHRVSSCVTPALPPNANILLILLLRVINTPISNLI